MNAPTRPGTLRPRGDRLRLVAALLAAALGPVACGGPATPSSDQGSPTAAPVTPAGFELSVGPDLTADRTTAAPLLSPGGDSLRGPKPPSGPPPADWRLLAAMLAAFAVLAGLRFVGRHRRASLPPEVFEVLGAAPLTPGHAVRVVRFADRTLLLAVSGSGCTTLAEITDADTAARVAAACRGLAPRAGRTGCRGLAPLADRPGAAGMRAVPDDSIAPSPAPAPPDLPSEPTGDMRQADSHEPGLFRGPGRQIAAVVICVCGWGMSIEAGAATPAAAVAPAAALTPAAAEAPAAAETLIAVRSPTVTEAPTADDAPASRPFDAAGLVSPGTIEKLLPSALFVGVASLVPAILLMTTCFVRMSIVLMLLRQGLGTPQVPGNQILASLALFLSGLVMWPVWSEAWRTGIEPYRQGVLEPAEAFERGSLPIRRWMSGQIEAAGNRDTMLMFLARHPTAQREAKTYDDVPLETLLPAFLVSELEVAFSIGFRILLPFLVLDILVAALVVSTGLVMLPPTLVSLPFKLLVFVAADGWTLLVQGLLDGVSLPA